MSTFFTAPATLAIHRQPLVWLARPALTLATLLALTLLLAMPPVARAQQAYSPAGLSDPPSIVARLNLAEGAVSFAPADANPDASDWSPAVLNRPLTSGDRLWSGPRARLELHIGATAVRMSEQTSLDFGALNEQVSQLRVAQGSVQLRVRTLFEGERLEVDTPNLAFVVSAPGNYRIDVNPASDTTHVVALSGGGVLYGDNGATLNLGSPQQGNFSGTQLTSTPPGPAFLDSFDTWAAARDRREDQSVAARYIPRETTGYLQLDSYGDWQQDASYGAVWLPRAVPANWAPYRDGHWSWISPWGWTWVDDAPWGFAPFHYGRWAQIGARWAWVPGQLPRRPVYAPALVAFIGGGAGLDWNLPAGSGGTPRPGVAWFPLAPGEAFRPVYRASPRYITQVNNNIAVNNTVNITNNYRYQHQPAAVTAVGRDDFFRSRPLQGSLRPLNAAELGRAQLLVERSALPQRPDARERPRLAPAAALPPAALLSQPVIRSRDERGQDRRAGPERIDPRTARPENHDRNLQSQALPVPPPAVQLPALRPLLTPLPGRAGEADQHIQREQARQQEALRHQSEALQQSQQAEQARQQDQQRRQAAQAQTERIQHEHEHEQALRQAEQARQQGDLARQQDAQRRQSQDLQQSQRNQQHQQAEQARQQDQQRRQNEVLQQRQQVQIQHEQARQQQQQRAIQQEQRRVQPQERQRPPSANAADEHAPRPDGERRRSQEP